LNKGKLYLIPTILAEETQEATIPLNILRIIKDTDIFIVENIRTARRHIKKIIKEKNIDKTTFHAYGKHDKLNLEKDFLPYILSGKNIGLLSEAGLPCIADPGSDIVSYAQNFHIDVVPLVGPSSIILALMASGLNGQNFAFNGYLPIEKSKRISTIKKIERFSRQFNQTQIFMETPYRNNQLIKTLLKICNNNIRLCIASEITKKSENIKTKTIAEWKQTEINLNKKPTIFLIG
tara:strand:+ start:1900 stop:2604 length:705 start_codon:yes stop_codon:yes gene_type:complete